MHRIFLPFTVALGLISIGFFPAHATPSSDADSSNEPQRSGDIELPMWGEDEFHECFDIRIWPDRVVFWLEQENIRDLIADPETPDEERKALKLILAQQNAWRST